jgi:hypothetical protein
MSWQSVTNATRLSPKRKHATNFLRDGILGGIRSPKKKSRPHFANNEWKKVQPNGCVRQGQTATKKNVGRKRIRQKGLGLSIRALAEIRALDQPREDTPHPTTDNNPAMHWWREQCEEQERIMAEVMEKQEDEHRRKITSEVQAHSAAPRLKAKAVKKSDTATSYHASPSSKMSQIAIREAGALRESAISPVRKLGCSKDRHIRPKTPSLKKRRERMQEVKLMKCKSEPGRSRNRRKRKDNTVQLAQVKTSWTTSQYCIEINQATD